LKENILALLEAVKAAKPVTLKTAYILSVSVSTTMGIGLKISLEGLN
jgi:ribosomal protein L1